MTIWPHLGPDLGFLQDSGYAVIRFALAGGGEVTAEGDPDFLGQRGPLVVEPSRIVMRTCAAPKEFLPAPMPTTAVTCCKEPDAEAPGVKTGIDLAMVLDTGVGPMVLSRTAWLRVVAALVASGPDGRARRDAGRRAARRDLADPDPGHLVDHPEVRARRSRDRAGHGSRPLRRAGPRAPAGAGVVPDRPGRDDQVQTMACTQPCDADPREPDKAQNSAAYLEVTRADPGRHHPRRLAYLQGLRFDSAPGRARRSTA